MAAAWKGKNMRDVMNGPPNMVVKGNLLQNDPSCHI
jgi:hypothetical protein